MNVAVLGGSFNPPHIGHALIATQVKELFGIDEVWLMPNFAHAFGKEMATSEHRLAMTKLLNSPFIKTSEVEIDEEGINYTIDTFRRLYNKYPQHKFFWVIGSDQLENIKKWREWQDLLSTYDFIVFARPKLKDNLEKYVKSKLEVKIIPKNIKLAQGENLAQIEISSTTVRQRVKQKKSIKYMVPEKVERYILKNNLYE